MHSGIARHHFTLLVLTIFVLALIAGGCGSEEEGEDPSNQNAGEDVEANACGGEASLTLDGNEVEPGGSCGECGNGRIVCDGTDDVRCVGATGQNECGGCEFLHAEKGDSCGPCGDGVYQCNGDGGLDCIGAGDTNACGGCEPLADVPGDICSENGEEGIFGCTSPEDTRCMLAGENVCGGESALDSEPGGACGTCDGGVVACDGLDDTRCVDADRGINDCGGCQQLPGMVGWVCGSCDGELVCDGEDDLSCQGSHTNFCGGCEELDASPGEACDDASFYYCESPDSLACPDQEVNACGGNESLDGAPGDTCGPCDDGTLVCAALNELTCVGAREDCLSNGNGYPYEPDECDSDDDCEDDEVCDEIAGHCAPKDEPSGCGPGAIVGETCTADSGALPYADIMVEGYDCDGAFFSMETVADENGAYDLAGVPSGTHELTISSGSFEVTDDVSVQVGENTDLASVGSKLCFTGTEVDIAVIPGAFDDIGGLLDNMSIEYTVISSEIPFLSDLDQMKHFDVIFVACHTDAGIGGAGFDADTDEIAYNIRHYVETGHSLYVSDYSQPVLQFVIPEAFEFVDGDTVEGPRVGSIQEVTADVVSDDMALILDSDTVDIHFETSFTVLEAMGPNSEEQFRSDLDTSVGHMENRPLMGIYDDPNGGGRAIFTSFHNSQQMTSDMENILKHTIFQL